MRKIKFVELGIVTVLALSLLAAASGVSIMENPNNWKHPEQATVKNSEMAFTGKKFSHFTNDGLFFMSRFNNGWVVMSQLFRWGYGPVSGWGIYVLISDPNGTKYWAKTQLDEKNIQMAPDRIFLKSGKNYIDGGGMTYKIHYDFEGFFCDLTFKNVLPPWRPGDGWTYLSPDHETFSLYFINSPWANVTGTIKIGGKTLNVSGQGYSDRSTSAYPPMRMNQILYSIRTFSPDETPQNDRWFFGLLESVSHSAYGSKRIPIITLAHGDKWVLTTKNYTLTPLDFVKGPGTEYTYPTRVLIRANDNGVVLDGEYRSAKIFDFTDIFAELPAWLRNAASKFLKRPVFFRSLGEFKATVKTADGTTTQIRLPGPIEYMVIK